MPAQPRRTWPLPGQSCVRLLPLPDPSLTTPPGTEWPWTCHLADVLSERSGSTRALLPSSHNGWEHVSLCPAVLRAHWVLGTLRAALEGAQPRARVPRPAVWGGPHRVWLGA